MERRPVRFYREVLRALTDAHLPFLIGGAFAFCRYAGIDRRTKDLDLMIEEVDRTLRELGDAARAVHDLADTIQRQPDMLVKGRAKAKKR